MVWAAAGSLFIGAAGAAPTLDFKDYDNDLMRDLDKTIKYFEPDITAGNADAAKEDLELLADGFRYTEDYFSKKKGADDAVEISRRGSKILEDVRALVEKSQFEAAAVAARETPGVCKSCHDIYKPRLAR
ncbi:MAG TPA: hypothetical protein VK446_08000 [Methylocystis sp.]|nr:hypothetical protein [Methylocystis sp.]